MFNSIFAALIFINSINNVDTKIPDYSSITQEKHVQEAPLNSSEEVQPTDSKSNILNLDYGIYDLHLVFISDADGNKLLSKQYIDNIPLEKAKSIIPFKIKSEQLILNKDKLVCFTIKSYRIFVGQEDYAAFSVPDYYIIKNKFSQ